jgi:hypothetical protein
LFGRAASRLAAVTILSALIEPCSAMRIYIMRRWRFWPEATHAPSNECPALSAIPADAESSGCLHAAINVDVPCSRCQLLPAIQAEQPNSFLLESVVPMHRKAKGHIYPAEG